MSHGAPMASRSWTRCTGSPPRVSGGARPLIQTLASRTRRGYVSVILAQSVDLVTAVLGNQDRRDRLSQG